MDSIDKWLKSLRLHKYTHLFKSLTYQQMLALEEKYLIDLDITKGARNKILVSVKKLNLRQERLFNMMDDLKQDNISMKEALTVLKDMLITPIPPPSGADSLLASPQSASPLSTSPTIYLFANGSNSNSSGTSCCSTASICSGDSPTTTTTMTTTTTTPSSVVNSSKHTSPFLASPLDYNDDNDSNNHYYSDPNQLTHLFVDTFEKVAHRLIESAGMEDNACHGIMAAIVDECLKHNSFTKGHKARVASFKQHFMKEQKARMASYKQQLRNNLLQQQQQQQQLPLQRLAYGCGNQYTTGLSQNHSYNHHHQTHQFHNNGQHHYQNHLHNTTSQHCHYNSHNNGLSSSDSSCNNNINEISRSSINKSCSYGSSDNIANHHYHHQHNNHWNHVGPIYHQHQNHHHHRHHQASPPPSLSASLSTIGSASISSTSDEEEQQRQRTYKEYSLLGPGMTFELPCLRATVTTEKHNRSQLGFLSPLQS